MVHSEDVVREVWMFDCSGIPCTLLLLSLDSCCEHHDLHVVACQCTKTVLFQHHQTHEDVHMRMCCSNILRCRALSKDVDLIIPD